MELRAMSRGWVGRWNKATGKMMYAKKEDILDLVARHRNNPIAPMVMQDTIDWMKHPGTGAYTDSRSTFESWNKVCGLVPADTKPIDYSKPTAWRDLNDKELSEVEADIDQAFRRAHNDLTWGAMPLTEAQKAAAALVNDKFEQVTGRKPEVKGAL